MHKYSDSYIAVLDIIGFKAMLGEKTCEEIYSVFSHELQSNPLWRLSTSDGLTFNADVINMKVMSDTICLYVDSSIDYALAGLIHSCLWFQEKLLCCSEYILMRGAIVRGNIFVENDILFGKGFVDAYRLGDQENPFPRIILSDEIVKHIDEQMKADEKELIQGIIVIDDDGKYAIDVCEHLEGFDTDGMKCKGILRQIERNLNACDRIREKHLYLKDHLSHLINQDKFVTD